MHDARLAFGGRASTRPDDDQRPMNQFLRALLLAMLAVAALAPAARADDFAQALAPLAKDSFADTASVAEGLAELGDPRGVTLLRALAEGELFLRKSDSRPVLRVAGGGVDALTGAPVAFVAADFDQVRVNNRVRGAVRGALGRLSLQAPDRAERLEAARAVLKTRSADNIPLLEKSLGSERDPAVRAAKETALAASRLLSPSQATQLAGIAALAASLSLIHI